MANTANNTAPTGSWADWASDALLRGAIAGVLKLPYPRRVAAMGAVFGHALGPASGYRRRAEAQLSLIWPDMRAPERRKLAAGVLDNFGRTLIETFSGDEFTRRMAATPIAGAGLSAIAEARGAGRPVVFITGHFGNHEAPRHALVSRGYQIGGLYRPMANPYTNAHYAPTLTRLSGPVVPQTRQGIATLMRHLAGGGMATLLFDVWTGEGVPLDFLGQPALTALSAAELSLRYDALLVPYFAIRQPDGLNFDIVVEAPIAPATPRAMMEEATARLEAHVRAHPSQWFWVHRRWKLDRLAKRLPPDGGVA